MNEADDYQNSKIDLKLQLLPQELLDYDFEVYTRKSDEVNVVKGLKLVQSAEFLLQQLKQKAHE
ncbi:MAG: hypothetical protein OXC67_09375 [Flavobacteriaceae bacterium]|nr:hypothetical protein [Flavobacteriaceae bacterium]